MVWRATQMRLTTGTGTRGAIALSVILLIISSTAASAGDTLGSRLVDPDSFENVPLDAAPLAQSFHVVVKRLGGELVLRTFDTALDDFRQTFVLDASGGGVDSANAVDDGRVVWISDDELLVRKFGADGAPDGGSQVVVSPSVNVTSADVAVASDGRTLVVWSEIQVQPGDPPKFLVFGRFYDSNLNADGGAFEIDDAGAAVIADAVGTEFAVAWQVLPTSLEQIQLVLLSSGGNEQWRTAVDSTFDPGGIAGLSDGGVMLGYGRNAGGDGQNAYVQVYSNAGVLDPDSTYRLSLPRDDAQTATSLGVIGGGDYVAAAFHSAALGGLLDFVHLDRNASPRAATGPLVDNQRLGSLSDEKVCRFRPVVSAGGAPGGPVAVFYSASSESTVNNPVSGCFLPAGRMVLLPVSGDGSGPPCPSGVSCAAPGQTDLVPFRTAGPAERRLNIVVRPAAYDTTTIDGERKFLRELRDVLVTEIFYGAAQHREHRDKFNFLYQLKDGELENPPIMGFGVCESPIGEDEFFEFQESFPWVYAVGAQMNRDFYDRVLSWCANIGALANGGGTFFYPAGIWTRAGVFEHELSHAIYGVFDEYEEGGYGEPDPPAPLQHQWLTEQECRDAATTEGVDPIRCRLNCLPDDCANPKRQWYTYEFKQADLFFNNQQDCLNWVAANSPGAVCVQGGNFWSVPTLRDVMALKVDGTATVDPTDRTVNMGVPAPSFQQACEQRPLSILTDPGLTP